MSIIGRILRPFIIKELKNLMKDFIQPILDLIKTLVQPQQGTKFLITVIAVAAIYMMHKGGIATNVSDIVIGVMVPIYYVADMVYKLKKKEPTA